MPRIRRLHRLEPAEQEYVQVSLGLIRENINTLYTLVDQRFGVSDKRALRLQALKRKLVEVESLFAEITSSGSVTSM
jgi:hypothetical protein